MWVEGSVSLSQYNKIPQLQEFVWNRTPGSVTVVAIIQQQRKVLTGLQNWLQEQQDQLHTEALWNSLKTWPQGKGEGIRGQGEAFENSAQFSLNVLKTDPKVRGKTPKATTATSTPIPFQPQLHTADTTPLQLKFCYFHLSILQQEQGAGIQVESSKAHVTWASSIPLVKLQ